MQTDLSKYEACKVEIELISYYKKHNISYNNSNGGDINTGWHYTMLEETKQKISKSNKGRNISDITRKKISESLKGKLTGEKNPMYGKHFTEESKIKLINSLKGKMSGEKHPMYGKHHKLKSLEKLSETKKIQYRNKSNHPRYKTGIILIYENKEYSAPELSSLLCISQCQIREKIKKYENILYLESRKTGEKYIIELKK